VSVNLDIYLPALQCVVMRIHLTHIAAAIFAVFLASCGSGIKPVPETPVGTPTEKRPAASTPIKDVKKLNRAADREGTAAREKLRSAQADLEKYQGRVNSMSEMIARLRALGSATALDLATLAKEAEAHKGIVDGLNKKLADVQESHKKERELRDKAAQDLTKALQRAVDKENEADTLREQLGDRDKTIVKLEENAQENFDAAMDSKSGEDRAKGQRNMAFWILGGVSFVLLLSLLLNYLQLKGIF